MKKDDKLDLADLTCDTHGELCAKILNSELLNDMSIEMCPYSGLIKEFINPETGEPIKEEK